MKLALISLAVAFATAFPAVAGAQTESASPAPALTADDVIARAKIADDAGTRSESERETWSTHVAGLDGTLVVLRRGDNMTTQTASGPFKTARGTWHGQKWHQNDNGETILDRPEPSQVEHPITQTIARVRDPVDAWEIVTTFASGHVTRFFYDPKTFFVIRTERVVAGHVTHTIFDDFRTDARGRTRYWHYFGGDERPDNDFDYRLQRDDETTEVADADVAIPHDRRTLVEFPAGTDTVRLPARIDNGRIYVRVAIAGRGLDFLLDTGASIVTIDGDVARDLKLATYGRITQTVAGSFVSGRVIVPELSIGPLVVHDFVMHTVPFASSESHDTRVVGLLGFDFLDALELKIDYANGTLDASRPGIVAPPVAATALDVRLNSGTPVARASLGDATGEDFLLDTGAAFSYVVFQRFVRAHPDAFATNLDGGKTFVGSGVGGSFTYRKIASKRVTLGTWALDDDDGAEAVGSNALGFDNEDGVIGSDFLRLFTVYLDYASSRVFLAPNGRMPVVELGPAPAAPHGLPAEEPGPAPAATNAPIEKAGEAKGPVRGR